MKVVPCSNCGKDIEIYRLGNFVAVVHEDKQCRSFRFLQVYVQLDQACKRELPDGYREGNCPSCARKIRLNDAESRSAHEAPLCEWWENEVVPLLDAESVELEVAADGGPFERRGSS